MIINLIALTAMQYCRETHSAQSPSWCRIIFLPAEYHLRQSWLLLFGAGHWLSTSHLVALNMVYFSAQYHLH